MRISTQFGRLDLAGDVWVLDQLTLVRCRTQNAFSRRGRLGVPLPGWGSTVRVIVEHIREFEDRSESSVHEQRWFARFKRL